MNYQKGNGRLRRDHVVGSLCELTKAFKKKKISRGIFMHFAGEVFLKKKESDTMFLI